MALERSFDDRLLSHYSAIEAIRAGHIPPPRMAIIYPMYGCHFSCVGCEYQPENAAGFVRFPTDRLISLLAELRALGVEGIEFCGGGEPALHSGLIEAVLAGHSSGLRFGLLSSGLAISDRFLSIAAPLFSYIRISVDAASERTYRATRPTRTRNPWSRLIDRIEGLVCVREQTSSTLDVSMKFTIGQRNYVEIREMILLAVNLRASNAQFKALRLDPSELTANQAEEVDRVLNQCRLEFSPFPIHGSVEKLTMKQRCALTPLQVTIDAEGDVYLCCYFRHRKNSHRIGNVMNDSFASIWGSERHRAAIASIVPMQCNNLDCRFVRYHQELQKLDDGYAAFI